MNVNGRPKPHPAGFTGASACVLQVSINKKIWLPLFSLLIRLLEGDFMLDRPEFRRIPEHNGQYSIADSRPMVCYVYYIKRDKLLEDIILKLTGSNPK